MTESLPDNFPALVERASREFGASEAISDGDVSLDFAELGRRIDRASAALVASGISPGDRVAVWAPNSWEWVVAAMAVFGAGAVLVPVNTRFKGREAAFVLQKAEVKTLFTVVGFLGNDYVTELSESGENVESLEDVVILRGDTPEGTVSFQDFLNRGSDADQREARDRASRVLGSDLGLIMFTSGTTGVPKGVMVEQGPIIRGFSHYARELGMRQGDRMLIVNPFFHAFGFNGAINPCFIHGATMLPHPVFDVPAVLQRIQDDKVTVFPGPPAIFQGLINYKELDRYDISSLRSAVTGAASIPVETVVDMSCLLYTSPSPRDQRG